MKRYEAKIFSRGMDNLDLLLIRIGKAIADSNTDEAVASVAEARELLGSVADVLLENVPQDGDAEKEEVTTAVTRIRPDTAIDRIFSLLVARDNQPVTFREMEEAGIDCRSARHCVYASGRRMAAFARTKQGRHVAVKLKKAAFELLQRKYASVACNQQ